MSPNWWFLSFFIVKIFFIFQNDLGFEKCSRIVQNIFHFAKFSHIGKMLSDWQNVGVKLPIFAGGPTSFRCCFRHLTKFNKNHTTTFFLLISWEHFLHFTLWAALRCTIHKSPFHQELFYKYICVCFLDLKIYENPTHIGRVSAWSKTGAAIFILKNDVRKWSSHQLLILLTLRNPRIQNHLGEPGGGGAGVPSVSPLHLKDWENLVCKIMFLQTRSSHFLSKLV